ncbi:MAG TPA: PIN domain-containing protein [Planctomycetaceae bacterium]
MSVGSRPPAFIDSNVWLYAAVGDDPSKQRAAATLVRGVAPVVSVQVINEVCSNLLRKAGYPNFRIGRLVRSFYRRCTVVGLDRDLMLDAAALRDAYSLSYWDSLVVAAADRSGVPVLYSEDLQDGLVVRGRLRIENPFRP